MARLNLKSLKITMETENGPFGTYIPFTDGLNIIRANNSRGKSSCLNSIIYVLGIEELLGGSGPKTMKPAIKDTLSFNSHVYTVIESKVQLEIYNEVGKVITLTRWVKSESKDHRLVRVHNGSVISSEETCTTEDYYVHLSGSAKEERGFHSFLASFIGWDLPLVPTFNGNDNVLYIQTLFPLFFIEQIRGWQSFYAPPLTNYGIRELGKRSIEFILNLDIMENTKKKDNLRIKKASIQQQWSMLIELMKDATREVNGVLSDISDTPDLSTSPNLMVFNKEREPEEISISLAELRESYHEESTIEVKQIKDVEMQLEERLGLVEYEVMSLQDETNILRRNLQEEVSNRQFVFENIQKLNSDLKKNKEAKKLYDLGSEFSSIISDGRCPTCNQHIQDTLLPQDINLEPMSIDENIKYILEQLKAMEFAVSQSELVISHKRSKLGALEEALKISRRELRLIKNELNEDPKKPTRQNIETIINIKWTIKKYEEIIDKFDIYNKRLNSLKDEWKEYLVQKNELPKEYFTDLDTAKLSLLGEKFKEYLTRFNYNSTDINQITISSDKYTPVVKGFDIKLDSSASDHIRLIWAYSCALNFVSNSLNGNHPNLNILDEPGQHQMAIESQEQLYTLLTEINGQKIVATSLSPTELSLITKKLSANIIDLGELEIFQPTG